MGVGEKMNWQTILVMIFGSGAIFSLVGEIILYKIKRNDAKKDETLTEIKHLKQVKMLVRVEMVIIIVMDMAKDIIVTVITNRSKENGIKRYKNRKEFNGSICW